MGLLDFEILITNQPMTDGQSDYQCNTSSNEPMIVVEQVYIQLNNRALHFLILSNVLPQKHTVYVSDSVHDCEKIVLNCRLSQPHTFVEFD